jgi:hypothetical protein
LLSHLLWLLIIIILNILNNNIVNINNNSCHYITIYIFNFDLQELVQFLKPILKTKSNGYFKNVIFDPTWCELITK